MSGSLRFITYLSPSIPLSLFERVVSHVGEALSVSTSLHAETAVSGPGPGAVDPFTAGAFDVGFLCSPSLSWLQSLRPSPIELVSAAPVFDDPRAEGRPVYFADVIVRRGAPARTFEELRAGTFAYNDASSLSDWFSLVEKLASIGDDGTFFRALFASGSHLDSIELVAAGGVDAAAIDSNALAHLRRVDPSLAREVRTLESWGPFPVQPLVVRAGVDEAIRRGVTTALLSMPPLPALGLVGFAPVDEAFYLHERAVREACRPLEAAMRAR